MESQTTDKESLLSLEEILDAVDGMHVLGEGPFCFTDVQTDSRLVKEGTLFVPLIGEFQDGHKYVSQAVEKGAGVVFLRRENYESDSRLYSGISQSHPAVCFIVVENTLKALQDAAAKYVSHFPDLIRIGVTG